MFGIGEGELCVILLAAVIFLGPKRLPEVARWLAKAFHTLQGWKAEFDRQLTEIRREMESDAKMEPTRRDQPHMDDADLDTDADDYLAAAGEAQVDATPDYSYRQEVLPGVGDEGTDRG
ncbi:MAG: hypothetical protein B1H03_00115 [Planctomycetales bacterium 4484_113]|nr:MAG: hypothetical protein B1H03_00115 [Planctomycetales bacterium 4484_113]